MSADERPVATDALHTLGMKITPAEKRDAIHLAVYPAVAAQRLYKGQDVGLQPDGRAGPNAKLLGIVDPFLKDRVEIGEMFWLIVYPRQINSLRHVWEHSDFPASAELGVPGPDAFSDATAASRAWIVSFADRIDQTVNRLMEAADLWLECEDYTYDNSETYKEAWDQFPEFWRHYAIVTGRDVPEDKRESFFTCSC